MEKERLAEYLEQYHMGALNAATSRELELTFGIKGIQVRHMVNALRRDALAALTAARTAPPKRRELPVPLIAGGLLSDKADVLASLGAGALCVSASDESLWAL